MINIEKIPNIFVSHYKLQEKFRTIHLNNWKYLSMQS